MYRDRDRDRDRDPYIFRVDTPLQVRKESGALQARGPPLYIYM